MSKRKTIDAFFKKKDASNSEIRTPVAVETNLNTSIPDEHSSKCPKLQFEEIDRDLGSRKQICEFPINQQDEIRRAYLKKGPYQPENIDYPYNDDTHRRRFQPSWFGSHKDWLEYSPSMDAIYCLPCYLFSKKPIGRPGLDVFISRGFNNWKNVKDGMNCPLIRHERKEPNSPHKITMKCCEDLKNHSRHIDKLIEKQTSKELENNRLQLKTSVECARWLAFQACAFRGHDESLDSKNRARDESKREQMAIILRLQLALVTASREVKDVHQFFDHLVNIINIVVGSSKRNDELQHAQVEQVENMIASNEIETGRGANQIEIMRITNVLSQALQQCSQDLLNAMHLVSTTKSLIQKLRDDGWEPLLASVIAFCEQHEIDIPDMNARYAKGRGRYRRQDEDLTMEHYFRICIFTVAIDSQLQELKSRFCELTTELVILSSALNPKDAFRLFNITYSSCVDPSVSTATTERAFSTMKLLKTRLRNRMEDEFLADNMIVYIEKEIAGNFTMEMIMDEFYSMKNRVRHDLIRLMIRLT
ncbi:uncharacterized protein LOC136069813 [Quercus suber]|uniref:uncharacterized protein LOC136069813 n=1 Tax=Quercus suber TaxID=58331 RepID=UPI0032DF1E29